MCYTKYMLPKIIIVASILTLGFFGFKFIQSGNGHLAPNLPVNSENQPDQQGSGDFRPKAPFYNKGGISLEHTWPGEGNFSKEETEVLLFNESGSSIEVKSFDLVYLVEERSYPQKSGTWEKFPSKQSWDKIEYLNISPQYYKNEPLILEPGQKGKLHWHMNFGSQPLDGKQTVHLKLTLLKGNETIAIDEQFKRDSGTVVNKEGH